MRTRKVFWLLGVFAFVLFSAYPGVTGVEPNREARGPVMIDLFNPVREHRDRDRGIMR